jgi:hypothetical protein
MASVSPNTSLRCRASRTGVGVGYVVAGIFPETTPIHQVVGATFVYLDAALAFLVIGFLLRGERAWQGWAVSSLIASRTTMVLVAITFYTFSPSTPPSATGRDSRRRSTICQLERTRRAETSNILGVRGELMSCRLFGFCFSLA